MANRYTAITKQDGDWWIGWVAEVPGVNGQERTEKELLDSLRAALREVLQFNREEAIKAASADFTEVELVV
jgi:predicted RNase H-like HicB family nuclease